MPLWNTASRCLLNLMHRGAAGADESTGDGAGILMQLPHEFLAAEADRLGFALPAPKRYGVAMLFLSATPPCGERARKSSAGRSSRKGSPCSAGATFPATTAPWARSPAAPNRSCGRHLSAATAWRTRIWSGGFTSPASGAERRVVEALGSAADEFYVPSMSCRTICYKGMFLAPQLFAYYSDLGDARMKTALAVVHQRYSTNTFPSWRLAQPFRMIAHNGEINTLRGNANRLQAYEKRDDLRRAWAGTFPTCSRSFSRAAAIRPASTTAWNCSIRAGRSAPHALMMMIPEAFGPRYHISTDKRAFYEYHAAIMEPWDGPAAMVFTDGRLVGGTLDRNGLRPCRYVVTTDGLVVLASEAGRDRVPPRADRAEGATSAGPHVPGRYRGGPHRRRQRDQGEDRPPKTLSPLAGGEPHRAPRAVPALAADRGRSPHGFAAAAGVRLHPRRVADGARPRWPRTARSRSARWGPTRRWRCSRIGRGCCSNTSSNCLPR